MKIQYKYDTSKFKDDFIRESYDVRLDNKFPETSTSENADVYQEWSRIWEVVLNTEEEILGFQEIDTKEEWFGKKCKMYTNQKNRASEKLELLKRSTTPEERIHWLEKWQRKKRIRGG